MGPIDHDLMFRAAEGCWWKMGFQIKIRTPALAHRGGVPSNDIAVHWTRWTIWLQHSTKAGTIHSFPDGNEFGRRTLSSWASFKRMAYIF